MTTITDLSQLDLNGTYSYADYIKWRFDERIELLRGKIARMSPAPNVNHQRVSGNLYGYLFNISITSRANFSLHPSMCACTIEKNPSKPAKRFIRSYSRTFVWSVTNRNWTNRAATGHPNW